MFSSIWFIDRTLSSTITPSTPHPPNLQDYWNFTIRLLSIFTNPSARAGYDTRSVFKRSFTGLNSEFSFSKTSCLTKAEEISLSYYLPIAGGRIVRFIPFPRVLVLCEMLSVSSRIWTRITVSISYDVNDYITGTIRLLSVISRILVAGSYTSAKVHSVYSTTPNRLRNHSFKGKAFLLYMEYSQPTNWTSIK